MFSEPFSMSSAVDSLSSFGVTPTRSVALLHAELRSYGIAQSNYEMCFIGDAAFFSGLRSSPPRHINMPGIRRIETRIKRL